MHTLDFYRIIDTEIEEVLEKYKEDRFLQRHKGHRNNQKAYSLLIWFLEFYGKIYSYTDFITDGEDDSSCDIVFEKTNHLGERVFYVVQSKWNNQKNSTGKTSSDEIKKALSDFRTVLRGEKQTINEKLQGQLLKLQDHLRANGEVKFIFLTLSQYQGGADHNIEAFLDKDDKIKFEVIDIDRIKADYIDRHYKLIDPINPLEKYISPEESPITLEFAQSAGHFIKIEKPYEAYLTLLRPKMIYELFEKYGFALFFKNVRNPLLQSQFNQEIEKTAIEEPQLFWYYNNGITAITLDIPPIGKNAKQVVLTGLQIINGAQTVYAIHRAYKNASPAKRAIMDANSFVTLRLMQSGGKNFDLNVTRFTNSQNPVTDRDFWANDYIQVKLQNASFQTSVWYEKRRGEFRKVPEHIQVVSNEEFARLILAYHLQEPYLISHRTSKQFFISQNDHKEGLYEMIFAPDLSYEDLLAAHYIRTSVSEIGLYTFRLYLILGLFKSAFAKYLTIKRNSPEIKTSSKIVELFEKGDTGPIYQTIIFLNNFLAAKTDQRDIMLEDDFEKIKDLLAEYELKIEEIENIELPMLKDAPGLDLGNRTSDE
jgi:hypothetical protein